uniref:Uncharacterized protein n=1 Tax=viral metagenome TaxID=1070528 RepID=A0A6H1ZUU1_9ZZZZ
MPDEYREFEEEERSEYKKYKDDGGKLSYDKWLVIFYDWRRYRSSGGGAFDFPTWIESGQLSVKSEQAALSYLGRLRAWIFYMEETAGWSEKESDAVFDAEYDELFGGGKPVGGTSNWSRTNTYFTSLTTDAQTRIEDEAKALQQQQVDIARQQQALPLGQGGTGVEQIWAAENAIRDLNTQLSVAPDYLKPVIQGQIASLRDFQVSQKTIEGIKASGQEPDEAQALALKLYGNRKEKGYSFIPWLRDTAEGRSANQYVGSQTGGQIALPSGSEEPGSFAQSLANQVGISAQEAQQAGLRYAQHPESEEFANLTQQERTSLAWAGIEATGETEDRGRIDWLSLTPEQKERYYTTRGLPVPESPEPLKPFGAPAFKDITTTGGVNWRDEFERRYPSILREFEAQPEEKRTEEGWAETLERERKRLKEQWYKRSPYDRGERPGAFAPTVRTVQF